jgi:hypothetical protein
MPVRAAILPAALALLVAQHASSARDPLLLARHDVPRVYSADPADPWNRIFAILFTRTISAFETSEYPEAHATAPLPDPQSPFVRLRVSTRTFEHDEVGDRAVEALYPSFITTRGVDYVLQERVRGALTQALEDAIGEKRTRPPLDRALMQSDLWSAFDRLDARASARGDDRFRREGAAALTPLLAALIRKLALTPAEIAALPDTYAAARAETALPDVFAPDGEWVEVERGPHRLHDAEAQMRRASRVFVRPRAPASDETRFLDRLAQDPAREVSATALVMQTLLLDSRGRVVSSRLFTDVQERTLSRDGDAVTAADVVEFELSRRMLRSEPARAFLHFGAAAPAYLPLAGNDYGFATPARDRTGATAPILTTLRSRCAACHAPQGTGFMTFSFHTQPGAQPARVMRLREPNDVRALRVAAAKEERDDYKHLLALSGSR